MVLSRRNVLSCSCSLVAGGTIGAKSSLAQTGSVPLPPLPNKINFESGDLLWPKMPGSIIPYNSGQSAISYQGQEEKWSSERDAFLASPAAAGLTPAQSADLRSTKYADFYLQYMEGRHPATPEAYSNAPGLAVGHVAIVRIDPSGTPWVIEALVEPGVVTQTYDQWITGRPNQVVWHGRLRDKPKSDRSGIASVAQTYIGRPYNFWNFDLSDDTGFYCSKLAWLCISKACNVAVDDDPSTRRSFWFSPKQLLYANRIVRLHNPGNY